MVCSSLVAVFVHSLGTETSEPPPSSANITSLAPDDQSLSVRNHPVGGGSVMFSCEVSGTPTPTITWYYNNESVVQSEVELNGDSTQLTIPAPQVSHSGIYQCFARNKFGEDSRAWILEVVDPGMYIVILFSTMNDELVEFPHVLIARSHRGLNLAFIKSVNINFCIILHCC